MQGLIVLKSATMASFLKKLSKIDNKTKYGVYGWIMKAEKELQLIHIPVMISSICILYYHEDEIFGNVSKETKISKDGKCITKMSKSWSNTNYGINEIESSADNTYRWDFSLKRLKGHDHMLFIGITAPKQMHTERHICGSDERNSSYFRWAFGRNWDPVNEKLIIPKEKVKFYQGDKISMILDLSKSSLAFMINDKFKTIAYDDIKKADNIQYRMFVSIYFPDDCVEMLNFSSQ